MPTSLDLSFFQESLGWLKLHQSEYSVQTWQGHYVRTIIAYLSHDLAALKELAQKSSIQALKAEPQMLEFLSLACSLRLKIRENSLVLKDLESILESSSSLSLPALQGELQFLVAIGYEVLEQESLAHQFYLDASKNLEKSGIHRKAVKSLYNSLAAQTRIEPDKSYLNNHYLIYQKAKKAKDLITAGLALSSTARELQKLGCYHFSIKSSKKALLYLTPDAETLHYQMAVLNLCHTLCDLKKFAEANEYYLLIKNSSFPEIQGALGALEKIFSGDTSVTGKLVPTWLERLSLGNALPPTLSEHEQELIYLLSQKPRTKQELLQKLYGDKLDVGTKDNRFRNLLVRINKKHKDMILKEHAQYYLVGSI